MAAVREDVPERLLHLQRQAGLRLLLADPASHKDVHLGGYCLPLTLPTSQCKAGLRRLRWHDLRHSFASQAVASGVPLNVVQAWLGHSTVAMTMRYSHLAPNASSEWIKTLERQDGLKANAVGK